MNKIAGTINGEMYFNEDYIFHLLKAIEQKEVNIIEKQIDNLIDIFKRKKQIFLSLDNSKKLIEKLQSFLLDHYNFPNAHELYDIITL